MNPELEQAIATRLSWIFALIVPEIILAVAACVIFLGGTFRTDRHLWGITALAALIGAGGSVFWLEPSSNLEVAGISPLLNDQLAGLVSWFALVGAAILILIAWNEVSDTLAAEYHACILLTTAGLALTGKANDLITLFLALELISIPSYILLYLLRADAAAQEAAVKYFLLSVFSSALLLFGFSYLYGLAGTTNLAALMAALVPAAASPLPIIASVALVMVIAGLSFKITAVPFHFYAPDVYQGAATPAVAFLAFVPKAAGVVALIRVLGFLWSDGGGAVAHVALGQQIPILLWVLAAMTMTLGNVLALLQDNLKRLLAYSSVAHAGYMLVGLAVAPDLLLRTGATQMTGVEAVVFYLAAYGAMTIGVFAVIDYLDQPERPVRNVDDLAGLSGSYPGLALVMALFLFSLIGIPLTAGFAGKLLIFMSAIGVPDVVAEHARLFRWLALIMALNAAVAGWYYLRIVAVMYLRAPAHPFAVVARSWPTLSAVGLCALLTLFLGIYPKPLTDAASRAATPQPLPIIGEPRAEK
ncbi:MAG: NADH-quinone oxidoreductase subunit N [Gemmataceae bacterium]